MKALKNVHISLCRPILIISVLLITMTNLAEFAVAAYTVKAYQQIAGENSSMFSSSECLLCISKYNSASMEKRRGSESSVIGIC